MKNLIKTPRTIVYLTYCTIIFFLSSCGNNSKPEDTKEVAEEHNDAKFDNKKQEKDAQFLVNAAEINLEEIKLGQLAQEKGNASHIKELGKMMEDAHTKSLAELIALAKTKIITIPTSPTDNAMDAFKKLDAKSGNNFDKEYADMMVSGHKDAISTFEKAAENCEDADIKNWASTMLPDLRKHLDHAIKCRKEFEKM